MEAVGALEFDVTAKAYLISWSSGHDYLHMFLRALFLRSFLSSCTKPSV